MRKHIYTIAILLLCVLTLGSCNSWIEEDPDSLITDEKAGDSDDAAAQWVTGVYSKWIYDMFCWGFFPKVLEIDADYISGPDWLFSSLGAGNFQGDPASVDALWEGCYGLIGRANLAEKHIAAMNNISQAVKNNAIGEVKFQKAFAYFLLVRAYGPIPVQGEQETTDRQKQQQPRQSVDSVYNYITKNLEEAANMMYKNTDAGYKTGHVSAGSAAGLLTKVYATEASAAMPAGTQITVRTGKAYEGSGDDKNYAPLESKTFSKTAVAGYENMDSKALYTKAAKWAKAVIDGQYGSYELLSYDKLWNKNYKNASEFMFSIGSVSGDTKYKNAIHNQYEGTYESKGSEFIQTGGWIGCTRHWYDLFDENDYRITQGVKHRWREYYHKEKNLGFYYPNTEKYKQMVANKIAPFNDGVSYYYSMDSQCLAFTTKYADVTDASTEQADANWPFLRYADVLLLYAEAENELGNQQEALTYLNKVRERSNAQDGWLNGDGGLGTTEKMRSAIIEERAKEFACEADRRWDLIRWGIYLDAMNALGGSDDCGVNKSRTSRNLLYPIPTSELNTNHAIKGNNPGWN